MFCYNSKKTVEMLLSFLNVKNISMLFISQSVLGFKVGGYCEKTID